MDHLARWRESWIAGAIASLAKPHAWVLVRLIVVAHLRVNGRRRFAESAAIGAATALLILLPYLEHGRAADLVTLPCVAAQVTPVASANAHNFWWIVGGNPGRFPRDSEPVLGSLSYRQTAVPLVIAVLAFTLWRYMQSHQSSAFLLAAYQAFAWVMFTTQAHENPAFWSFRCC